MGAAETFGRRVQAAREGSGISKSELGRRLTQLRPGGRVFDAAGVSRIEADGPVKLDHELVEALIEALHLDAELVAARVGFDAADLWHAAGLWPEDLPVAVYRDFVGAGQAGAPAGSNAGSNPTPFDNVRWIRRVRDDQSKQAA